MKIGKIEFNIDALSKMTRSEFEAKYKGALSTDLKYTIDILDRYFKKEEVVQEVVQDEKPKRRRKRK